jgi:Ca-activated chloride channel family protein
MKTQWAYALALLLVGSPVAHAQTATFSTKLEAVRVDALVTDKGQVVRGLQPGDFEVLDNRIAQQVDLVSFDQIPLNVILALDMSQSVSGERLAHLQSASRTLLTGLKDEDRAALLTFSHMVVLREELTHEIPRVRAAIGEVEPVGDTALIDGVHAAMVLEGSEAGRSLLIVFSDGIDTSSWLSSEKVLETARRSDVVVYAVSVRGTGKDEFLRDLTDITGGATVEIESTKDLSATFVKILEEFRHRYLVSFSPRGVSAEGWHRLEVRVRNRRVTVKARPGYFAASRAAPGQQ